MNFQVESLLGGLEPRELHPPFQEQEAMALQSLAEAVDPGVGGGMGNF